MHSPAAFLGLEVVDVRRRGAVLSRWPCPDGERPCRGGRLRFVRARRGPRTRTDRLTDHSALAVQLGMPLTAQLPVSDPTDLALTGSLF